MPSELGPHLLVVNEWQFSQWPTLGLWGFSMQC
jgi:hypothetical protein